MRTPGNWAAPRASPRVEREMATTVEKKAARTQEKLADSADTMVVSAVAQESSADRRTKLAADRTLLAAERTYAAWMRTGLASLVSAIGAKALLENLVPAWLVLTSSIVLLVFAEFCFVAGVWRELTGNRLNPDPDAPELPSWLLTVFNGFLVLLGLAVLVGIVTR
jgi:putative membrane protein